MEDFDHLPEVVFGSGDSARSKSLGRLVKKGRLRKLASKLYTSNLVDSPETIVRRNAWRIAGQFAPGTVVSHRTALEAAPAKDGSLFLTGDYARAINLPGLTLRVVEGPGPQPGDTAFMEGLYMASRARAFLENMTPARARAGVPKTLDRKAIENRLDQLVRVHGEDELNRLRDSARELAPTLKQAKAFAELDRLIGAVLGTRDARALRTPGAKARALGVPYDPDRIELFQKLFETLRNEPQALRPLIETEESRQHRAFFEAYFSNYIEGTEFEVKEAHAIVYSGKIPVERPADAHDILGTYRLALDPRESSRLPETIEALLGLLSGRHKTLMANRPEVSPGRFKERVNRAGETVFVAPELVRGTLERGFGFYPSLTEPFARAAFMMFIISEVHPFVDGNGRIARLFMNAELSARSEARIIIPTVYRDDYMLALRRLSREGDPMPYLRMLSRAHAWSASLDFSDYDRVLAQLLKANAFKKPNEGKLQFDA